jgi:MarR family transcriptional regulator for hemolysin
MSNGSIIRSVEAVRSSPRHIKHGELFYMIHDLSRLVSLYFDRAMGQHQLTRAQWWGMMHVGEHEGATQTELADVMQMGRASAGKLLERLESKGWIERRPDETDSRVRRVFLTKNANAVRELMTIEGSNLFQDFLDGLSEAEEDSMLNAMRKMKDNGERHIGDSRPQETVDE